MAVNHLAEITHIDGDAIHSRHDNVADLFERRYEPDALNEQLFAGPRDVAAADIGVVAAKGVE